jgi:carbonic anhydrase
MLITPNEVLDLLRNRHSRFLNSKPSTRKTPRPCGPTQSPVAAILTCIDARVPVDEIFDNNDNSLMIARVAGNVASVEITGSLEYAAAVAGCKVIVVLGHTHCGAVASAIAKNTATENIVSLLSHIKPGNETDPSVVTINNIKQTCQVLESNTLLLGLIETGTLKIVGALYDVETCEISWL